MNNAKINTKFWNGLFSDFQPAYVLTRSKVTSDSVIEIWYTVWDKLVYALSMDGRFAKG